MKHKIHYLLAGLLILMCCAACSGHKETPAQTDIQPQGAGSIVEQPEQNSKSENQTSAGENSSPTSVEELFQISNLSGSVIEFSENGCTVSPTIYEDDIAVQAAPGAETEESLVTITYDENCIFQVAHASLSTGSFSCESATAADIKRDTYLVICGTYNQNNVLQASSVFLYRMEE